MVSAILICVFVRRISDVLALFSDDILGCDKPAILSMDDLFDEDKVIFFLFFTGNVHRTL
ncbi:hypothetical protein SPFM1_00254 [Salmonella phage SPFM1]|nr:hypothetical protein SPFM1_00254 [Salmonella phage SPFM1]